MIAIRQRDLIQSIADALQFISCYHPADHIAALRRAYEIEQSSPAKDAIAQILMNSRLCAQGQRPICQDTGIVNVFLKVGMEVVWDSAQGVSEMVNEGVRQAFLNPHNPLRPSIVDPPEQLRRNTQDNTPAVIHYEIVPGSVVEITIAAKGAGSENKARLGMLNPYDSIIDWVLEVVPAMGAGWCPPGVLGIGIGGTAEKAVLLAKESLMEPIDIQEVLSRGAQNWIEKLRVDLYERVNRLGIGAQGLGGVSTVLDVKIKAFPTHAASKPVAIIPNCAANRHVRFVLDGQRPAQFAPPSLDTWPDLEWHADLDTVVRVDVGQLTSKQVTGWKAGDRLLLSGKILTGRDAAHKRVVDLIAQGHKPPVDFSGRLIYYVGPVPPVRDEIVGPAGPTTGNRMDSFAEIMLSRTGLLGMIGKAELGPTAIDAIEKHQAAYLVAVGGAAYLISKAIRSSRLVAFEDLGMEAIYEFEVTDMPVTVAVDSLGQSIHARGPEEWKLNIAKSQLIKLQ